MVAFNVCVMSRGKVTHTGVYDRQGVYQILDGFDRELMRFIENDVPVTGPKVCTYTRYAIGNEPVSVMIKKV